MSAPQSPSTENVRPVELSRLDDRGLKIVWSDGKTLTYTARQLRDACPCATCREKKSAPAPSPLQLAVLSPEEMQPIDITGMQPVGSYAYSIAFTDGHNTGLYRFDLLRELGK